MSHIPSLYVPLLILSFTDLLCLALHQNVNSKMQVFLAALIIVYYKHL
jgi:hypothetical protein